MEEEAGRPYTRERRYTATDWAEFFWTDFVLKDDPNMDDLLFFVPNQSSSSPHVSLSTSAGDQQFTRYFVVRKHEDAEHRLPKRGDLSINWRDTYFLNIITNHLKYTLIMEVALRKRRQSTAPSPSSTTSSSSSTPKHRQRVETCVYASPTQVRMDRKEDEVTETYPNIFFAVNDFQEVLQDLTVSEEGELVCVKLLATMPEGSSTSIHLSAALKKFSSSTSLTTSSVMSSAPSSSSSTSSLASSPSKHGPVTIFSGAVGYEVVKQAFGVEARKQQSPASIRHWLSRSRDSSASGSSGSGGQVFLNMKGPAGKGKAQMAVNPATSPSPSSTPTPPTTTPTPSTPSSTSTSEAAVEDEPTTNPTEEGESDGRAGRFGFNSWMGSGLRDPWGAMRKLLPSSPAPASSSSSPSSSSPQVPEAFLCSLTSVLLPWTSIIDDVYRTNLTPPTP